MRVRPDDEPTTTLMNRPSLTLEQIGELAGVSRSTVSRVLNDHPHVSEDVKERVMEVVERTCYRPNQAARALVSNRTGLIGLVMPTSADDLFGDPYYSALVRGIQDGCDETGSVCSIFPFDGGRGRTVVMGALASRGFVDGVIATAGPENEALIATLRDSGKPLVVVGHPVDDVGLVRVDVENRNGSAAAVRHLAALGRSRIGFVGPPTSSVYSAERLAGYRAALAETGLVEDTALVRFDDPDEAGGRRAGLAVLRGNPDAVHVATDTMAAGFLAACRELGVSVPSEVAVVGFDGLPGGRPTNPTLTTVVQPVVDVGRTAVGLLRDGLVEPQVHTLATSMRIGESCGASVDA